MWDKMKEKFYLNEIKALCKLIIKKNVMGDLKAITEGPFNVNLHSKKFL